jgi:transcriptional regulator with XRE-family HTH domain
MLGDKLLKLRKKQGYSQQEVADLLGVSRQTISNWECDQGAPALDKAKELASLYKVDLNDLVADDIGVVSPEQDSKSQENDLHVLLSLKGKVCYIDCATNEWYLAQGYAREVRILDVNKDWLRIEYERSKDMSPFKKEAVIQLMDVSAISGVTIIEDGQ